MLLDIVPAVAPTIPPQIPPITGTVLAFSVAESPHFSIFSPVLELAKLLTPVEIVVPIPWITFLPWLTGMPEAHFPNLSILSYAHFIEFPEMELVTAKPAINNPSIIAGCIKN